MRPEPFRSRLRPPPRRGRPDGAPSPGAAARRPRRHLPSPAARLRHLGASPAARRHLRRRLLAGTVAAAALLAARAQAEAARGERARWDATVEVVVARDDLAPGDRATGDDLAVELRPAALVPDDALRALPDLPAVVGQAIASGEVVIGRRLGPEGTAASLPAGHAAVTISVSGRLPALSPGDRVDLLAAPPAVEPGSAAPRATLVARDAVVLEADDGGDDGLLASTGSGSSVTVAVADGDLGTAAAAALAGPVAVAVRSGS